MEYLPRMVEGEIRKWLNKRKVIVLRGPRRAGKTTILLHLRSELGGNYVSLDNEDALESFEKSPDLFVKRFGGKALFIDEAQYSEKAGRVIKYIHDTNPDMLMFVTGSGSFDVKVMISKYLVGRSITFEVYPLSFGEFLMWKSKDLAKIHGEWKSQILDFIKEGSPPSLEKAFSREMTALLEEYMRYGGFPEIVKEEDEEMKRRMLTELYRNYLERDVFFFFNVRHLEKFRSLMKYLSHSIGKMLVISSVCGDLEIDRKTVEGYLSILVHTYIIRLVPPFHKSIATEIKKSKKAYFTDIGLRNAALGNFSYINSRGDKGMILENFIVNELSLAGMEPKYWRTADKAEVDFVVRSKGGPVPIEVKAGGRPTKGFQAFLAAYRPKRAVIFSEKEFGVKVLGKTKVLFVPHWMV